MDGWMDGARWKCRFEVKVWMGCGGKVGSCRLLVEMEMERVEVEGVGLEERGVGLDYIWGGRKGDR